MLFPKIVKINLYAENNAFGAKTLKEEVNNRVGNFVGSRPYPN